MNEHQWTKLWFDPFDNLGPEYIEELKDRESIQSNIRS